MNEPAATVSKETRQVEIRLGGELRTIEVERYAGTVWHATNAPVVCRFRTGNKEHLIRRPQIGEKNGRFYMCVQTYRNRNVATPVRFATEKDKGCGWN